MKDNIKDSLVEILCKKSNYEYLKCTTLEADEYWVFYYIELFTCKTIHSTFNQSTTISVAHTPSHIPTIPQNPIIHCPGLLSQNEKNHCCALYFCLYCGDSGYIAIFCSTKTPCPLLNAIETLSTGFPVLLVNNKNSEKA